LVSRVEVCLARSRTLLTTKQNRAERGATDSHIDQFNGWKAKWPSYRTSDQAIPLVIAAAGPAWTRDLAAATRLLNQRRVLAFNRHHHRTGPRWESRFRSYLVDTEQPHMARAAVVDTPSVVWSSARTNLRLAG